MMPVALAVLQHAAWFVFPAGNHQPVSSCCVCCRWLPAGHLQQLLLVCVVTGVVAQEHSVLGLTDVRGQRINLR
jgi:hypothetical protein